MEVTQMSNRLWRSFLQPEFQMRAHIADTPTRRCTLTSCNGPHLSTSTLSSLSFHRASSLLTTTRHVSWTRRPSRLSRRYQTCPLVSMIPPGAALTNSKEQWSPSHRPTLSPTTSKFSSAADRPQVPATQSIIVCLLPQKMLTQSGLSSAW